MRKLIEDLASPTPWDSLSNYAGDLPDPNWLCLMSRNRDSDLLVESNWECALKILGGESDTVQISRTGHWACGWIEWLSVLKGSPAQTIAEKIEHDIDQYPVLDEDHFSELEHEEASRIWLECYSWEDRIAWIRDNDSQCEFSGFADMLQAARGDYFPGYASEICH
jgi:hypothetical protein